MEDLLQWHDVRFAAFVVLHDVGPDGRSVLPVFGKLFTNEPVPANGKLSVGDAPGFGMEIADRAMLTPFE